MKWLLTIICVAVALIVAVTVITKTAWADENLEHFMARNNFCLPEEAQQIVQDKGLIAWRGIVIANRETGENKELIVEYLTKEDNDKFFKGEFQGELIIQAKAAFSFAERHCLGFAYLDDEGAKVLHFARKTKV